MARSSIPVSYTHLYNEDCIEYIKAPGTLEGGDVMMVGDHFYVGRSARTNEEGIRQFIAILEKYGLSGSEVKLDKVLHLKTGVNYIAVSYTHLDVYKRQVETQIIVDNHGNPHIIYIP